MYPSDYGYAVGGNIRNEFLTNMNLFIYDDKEGEGMNNCSLYDWLNKSRFNSFAATMMPDSFSASNTFLIDSGIIKGSSVGDSFLIFPVVFLKSNARLTGDGTPTNPYVVSLN